MSTQVFPTHFHLSPLGKLGQRIAIAGLVIFVVFAPHSVAASAAGVVIGSIGWLLRTVAMGSLGLRRSRFDLIIALSLLWTVVSSFLSEEPGISIPKIHASWCVLLFYLARATLDKRSTLLLIALLIASGCAGALYSAFDLLRGRGVVVEALAADSPFHQVGIQPGDAIWRIGGRRVYSTTDLDEILRQTPANTPLTVAIISRGEQVERPGMVLAPARQQQTTPSGITSSARSHRFRASGWTLVASTTVRRPLARRRAPRK